MFILNIYLHTWVIIGLVVEGNKILRPKCGWNSINKLFVKKIEPIREDEPQSVSCIDWHMHYYRFLIKVTLLESENNSAKDKGMKPISSKR